MTGTATAYGWSAPSRKALMLRPRDTPLGPAPGRSLLRVVGAAAMVAVIAAAGTLGWLSSAAADAAARVSRLTNVGAAVTPLVHALQDEQTLSTAYARDDGPRGRPVRLQRQQQAVDQAAANFRQASADPRIAEASPAAAAALTRIRDREQNLAALRADVAGATATVARVRRSYAVLIDAYQALPPALAPHIDQPTLIRSAQAHAALGQAIETALAEQALLADALRAGRLGGDQQKQLAKLVRDQQAGIARFRSLAPAERSAFLAEPSVAAAGSAVERIRQAVLDRRGPSGVDARRWEEASSERIDTFRLAELALATAMRDTAAELESDAGDRRQAITLLSAVAVVSTLLLGVMLGKRGFGRKGRQDSLFGPLSAEAAHGPTAGTADAPPGAAPETAAPAPPPPPTEQHRIQPTLFTPTQDVLPGRPLLRHPVGPLQPATALPTAPSRAPGSTNTPPAGPQPDVPPVFPPVFPSAPSTARDMAAVGQSTQAQPQQGGENTAATASMALSELTRLFGSGPASGPAAHPADERDEPTPRPPRSETSEAPAKQ